MPVTRLRPSMLSSAIARKNLSEHEELCGSIFGTIDALAQMYEALEALQSSPDPLKTPEANALAYKAQHERAATRADDLVEQQIAAFAVKAENIKKFGREKAGLTKPSLHAAEIREALRSMDQKARDEAIERAIDTGESEVLASIIDVPRMLVGHITLPVGTLINVAVDKAAPECRQNLIAIENALEHLALSWKTFHEHAGKMRDAGLERAGEEGAAKAKDATKALDAALA